MPRTAWCAPLLQVKFLTFSAMMMGSRRRKFEVYKPRAQEHGQRVLRAKARQANSSFASVRLLAEIKFKQLVCCM